jgi:hypothetical protein
VQLFVPPSNTSRVCVGAVWCRYGVIISGQYQSAAFAAVDVEDMAGDE